MTTITLRNDFHNSESNIRVESLPHKMTPSQLKKVRRELCGNRDCACGSIRGPQRSNGKRLDVEFDLRDPKWNGDNEPTLVIRERPSAVPEVA